ncbi:MAG: DUF3800 domain-containing protein [Alphaproteobacteria bacterium]
MTTIYLDETGFTGEDLLAKDQPVFVQATMNYNQEEARDLISTYFPALKADELKYSRLRRNPKHRESVIRLIERVSSDSDRSATWIAHKEFALVTLLVDWWVEPLAHESGFNLYEDGANLAMANLFFYCMEGFWHRGFRTKLLFQFQRMMRTRNPQYFRECRAFINRERGRTDDNREEIIRYLWPSFELLGFSHVRGLPNQVLDIALPGLVALGQTWRSRDEGHWSVVHDQSSNMAKQKWLWDALSSPEVAAARFDGPAGPQHFPMNVTETRFADSKSEIQLQLCDVLAGATATYLRRSVEQVDDVGYAETLARAGIDNLIIGGLWPRPEVSPDELGMRGWDGNKAIEWISDQIARSRR